MIARWTKLDGAHVLEAGGGVGMYASQIQRRYDAKVECFDIELERTLEAKAEIDHALVAAAEDLPYASNTFDTIISNEVLEHVVDDVRSMHEMIRVLRPGGRVVVFVPNRGYPFETHGYYRGGVYHFGNIPLINYLPDPWRNQLAPHVRAYTRRGLFRLLDGTSSRVIEHRRIFGGYDNIIARFGSAGRVVRNLLHGIEGTPLDRLGLSHFLVVEKR